MIDPATLKILTKLFPIEEYAAYDNYNACDASKSTEMCWRKEGHKGPHIIWEPYYDSEESSRMYRIIDIWD